MILGKALGIFMDICNEEYTDIEKGIAIYKVMNMATHNYVPKAKMLEVIKWLWDRCFEIGKAEGATEDVEVQRP